MNINRDYLIINDVKKSNIRLDNGSMFFYITDKNTQNIFVNLVINVSNNNLIQKYANIENAEDYTLTMNIVKPSNTYKVVEGKLHDKENAIFEFNLSKDYCDEIGTYRCELLTKCNINNHEEITTSNKLTYKVKSSVLNDLDDIVEAPEYPLVIQLFDKLSDIEQYEEDRRANELARQLAEQQRQAKHDELVTDMTDRMTTIDNKVVEVEDRITAKEQAVDKLITDTKADIDAYKVAKDQEIDEYKALKDTEINEAIANQDNKIDEAISNQNDRITVVENNVVAQNNRLDIIENKNQQQDNRLDIIEAKNVEQDNRLNAIEVIDVAQNSRLDAIESKNAEQDDRLLDIEKVNKRQDMNLKCLFAESKNNMIDITEEGNSIYLQNSTTGYTLIDEIKGNTLVNCNKEPDKELILNGNINTSRDNTVTLTEGVDGGKVDVALEGNTLVNVSKTKDSTAISKAYTVENSGNHIALQGDIDGNCRPVITGNTLWIDNATEEVLTVFDETKNLRLQSSFEDNLVTQEMVDNGEEVADNLGKYKVEYKITGKNKFNINNLTSLTVQSKNGMTVSIENSKLYVEGTSTGIYDFRVASSTYNKVLVDKINKAPVGTSFILSNNISRTNFWHIIRDGKTQYIVDTFTKQQGDNIVEAFVRINTGTSIPKSEFNIQIEEGDTATSYEPYKEYTRTLYLNSPLLEGDTIEEINGKATHVHRYGTMNLYDCHKNNYTVWNNDGVKNGINWFWSNTLNNGNLGSYITLNYNVFSDKIAYIRQGNAINIGFPEGVLSSNDDAGVKAWIETNKPNVVYQLASPTYELIEQSNLVIPSYANGHLDFNTAVPVEKVDFLAFSEELTYLYANTQYTVQFISDKATTLDITLGGTSLLSQSIVAGLNRISITTPATLANNKLVISGVGANIMEVIVTDVDRELIYFEGMKSVGEGKELQVISINSERRLVNTQRLTHEPLRGTRDVKDKYVLIDGKWYIERKCGIRAYQEGDKDNYKTDLVNTVYPLEMPIYEEIDYNPLEVYSGTTNITTNSVIPTNITVKNHGFNCLLKPSTTYTISSNLGLNTVTTPSTLTEDCLRFMDTDTSDVTTMRDVLVLEGDWTTKADLIPANFSGIKSAFEQEYDTEKGKYKVNVKIANEDKTKENNITFYINEPLRGVGDVKDRVYVKDDKVIVERNCGSVTLDGSEDELYTIDNVNLDKRNNFSAYYNNQNIGTSDDYRHPTDKMLCDKMPICAYDYATGSFGDETGVASVSGRILVSISKIELSTIDLDGFKNYLNTSPLILAYALAEPIYEEVEYNDTKLFIESFKNSTLSYNSNVPVTSTVHYSYSVPIVDTVAQTANISDQQDSMIIDLATQVAVMEMMLM